MMMRFIPSHCSTLSVAPNRREVSSSSALSSLGEIPLVVLLCAVPGLSLLHLTITTATVKI